MGILRRCGLLVLASAAFVGCDEDGGTDFGLRVSPDTATVLPGGSTSAAVSSSGRVGAAWVFGVNLENSGEAVTGSVSDVHASASATTATLTVNTTATVPPGTYRLTVTVHNQNGPGFGDDVFTLTVNGGSFFLTTTPANSTGVTQGGNASVTVNLNRVSGNTSNVLLTATATGTLPDGMALGFVPDRTTGNSSSLIISTTGSTPVGSYPIVIHGNAPGYDQQVNLTINVLPICVVIADDFETDKAWIHTPAAPAGFSQTYARQTSGGNAAGYARMTHTLAGSGTISVLHLLQTTYDPGLPGNAISHINYSEDQIEFNPPNFGAQIGAGFVIMQNGVAVTRDIGAGGAFGNLIWQTATLPNLTQANFPGINFNGGGPLTFGFLRANSSAGNTYTTTHGIDNFRVEVCR